MLGRSPLELGLTPLEKECCQIGAETSNGFQSLRDWNWFWKGWAPEQAAALGCGAIVGTVLLGRALNQGKGNLCFLLFSLVHPVGGNQEKICSVSASTSEERVDLDLSDKCLTVSTKYFHIFLPLLIEFPQPQCFSTDICLMHATVQIQSPFYILLKSSPR